MATKKHPDALEKERRREDEKEQRKETVKDNGFRCGINYVYYYISVCTFWDNFRIIQFYHRFPL